MHQVTAAAQLPTAASSASAAGKQAMRNGTATSKTTRVSVAMYGDTHKRSATIHRDSHQSTDLHVSSSKEIRAKQHLHQPQLRGTNKHHMWYRIYLQRTGFAPHVANPYGT